MTSENYLLVPVHIEALVVGAPILQWTDLHPEFSRLFQAKILGSELTPDLFKVEGAKTSGNRTKWWAQTGIHLHWTLPEALKRGRQKPPTGPQQHRGEPEFPVIPNRWMVERIHRKPGSSETSVKAWVVESDYLHDVKDDDEKLQESTFPRLDSFALFDYIGKAFEYTSWKEQHPAYRIPLTALGYGDPAFAAYYPSCRSLLGFYDPLTDIEDRSTLAYLVAGWYSDPAKDILQSFKLEELQWACAAAAQSKANQVLCHGAIYNIQWVNAVEHYNSSVPRKSKFTISLGNNTTEALSALLARRLNDDNVEYLLSAFQDSQLTGTSDLLELDFGLHERGFSQLAGGHEFVIQKKRADTADPSGATDLSLPDDLEKRLFDLNTDQRNFERSRRECDGYRWELYATWCKWANEYCSSPDRSEPVELTQKLNEMKAALGVKIQELNNRKTKRDGMEQELKTMVEKQFADLEFVSSPAAPFWLANDPVVVISGPKLLASEYGRQNRNFSEDKELRCRVSGQELGSLVLDIPGGQATNAWVNAVDVFRISGAPFAGGGELPKGVTDRLLFEALLLDPSNADAIAEKAYVNAKLQNRIQKGKLIEEIKLLQRKTNVSSQAARQGEIFPSGTSLADWGGEKDPAAPEDYPRNPWLPLFLEWEVAWYPSYSNLSDVLNPWQLAAGNVDFSWKATSPDTRTSYTYRGYTILNSQVSWNLCERLRKYNENRHDPDLAEIIGQLDYAPAVGQTLSGLNDAFLMRNPCLQVTPLSPRALFEGETGESRRDPIIKLC